jgi:hypothetical protein
LPRGPSPCCTNQAATGRLLWGLACQRLPGTLILLGPPQLDPCPFGGAPSDPVALVPARLTSLPVLAARELRARLSLSAPEGAVRWHTPALLPAVTAGRERPPDRFVPAGRI